MDKNRVASITSDLIDAVQDVCIKHAVTHTEYRAAIDFVSRAIDAGERSLLFDAFLEANVVASDPTKITGTTSQVLGPFYLPDMPFLKDGVMARENELGERLRVSGKVLNCRSEPVGGVELDFWQADASGRYSHFDGGATPDKNLRGRIASDETGDFFLETVKPAQYTIPDQGPTGLLLREMGRHSWRPAHLHVIARHSDYSTLTTQIYFEGDEYLESDAVRAASTDLAFPLIYDGDQTILSFNLVLQDIDSTN